MSLFCILIVYKKNKKKFKREEFFQLKFYLNLKKKKKIIFLG